MLPSKSKSQSEVIFIGNTINVGVVIADSI
jgi:hypothetical protein